MNADRCDLAPPRPHSRVSRVPFCLDARLGECYDERLLYLAQIPVQVATVSLQIEDRIADELSGTVERDVATAFDFVDLDTARPKALR